MKQFEVYGDAMQIYTEACIIWLADWKELLEDDTWQEICAANIRRVDRRSDTVLLFASFRPTPNFYNLTALCLTHLLLFCC